MKNDIKLFLTVFLFSCLTITIIGMILKTGQ